ncbi:MAG: hypothetical protein OEU54_06235 [Gemmatimonadota bacterium]|nr:hypothetical protein [Gemmatimonadota bacterium]
MTPRRVRDALRRAAPICFGLLVLLTGCRQVITRDPPAPPPFPPDFDPVVTLHSGLILRGSGEVVSRNPTTLRISATVENPTTEEIQAFTLTGDCLLIVAGFWAQTSEGRLLQPLDGFVTIDGVSTDCERLTGFLRIGPGAILNLSREEDLVVSDVLGEDFAPGR